MTSLRIKDRMSFRWDQVRRPGESCPHGRLSLEDRRNLTWQSVQAQDPATAKGASGGFLEPFCVSWVSEIGPISLLKHVLMAFLVVGHLTQLVSIFVSLPAHVRPLQTGRSLISWHIHSSAGQVFAAENHHVFLWWWWKLHTRFDFLSFTKYFLQPLFQLISKYLAEKPLSLINCTKKEVRIF